MIMEVRTVTFIRCPVAEVFAFVTNVENDLRWQPQISEVRVTSEGPIGVGTTFREVRHMFGFRFVWDMNITVFEPNRRICIESLRGAVPYRGCRDFEPVEDGTRIIETSCVELWPVFRPFRRLLANQSHQPVEAAYARLKAILEDSLL